MKIGDQILKQVTNNVNVLEKQFNAVEIIDSFDFDKKDQFELISTIAKILKNISDCETSQIYMKINHLFHSYFSYPKGAKPPACNISDKIRKSNKTLTIINQKKQNQCLAIIKISSSYLPECFVVLQAAYFGRSNLKMHDRTFQDYLEYIAKKIGDRINNYSRFKMLENHRKLSQRFLTYYDNKDDISNEKILGKGSIWTNILKSTFDYMPLWGPLNLEGKPRVQILKVNKGRKFLHLLAESHVRDNIWEMVPKNLHLETKKTICGMFLDEDEIEQRNYINVNPRKHTDRYASIMFTKDDIPQSELIIPIRDHNGKAIVLFNFEHYSESSFSDFHVKMLIEMVKDLEPFVLYSIHNYEQQVDIEKKLRYLMLRITKKLTSTQQHKLKNDFGKLISAVKTIEQGINDNNLDLAKEEVVYANRFISEIKETSMNFTINIQDYIQYGKRDIHDIVNRSLPDVEKKAKLNGDNISIEMKDIPEKKYVFCSGMAQEHIHNILKNSMEQFINIRKSTKKHNFIGNIVLAYREIERSDIKSNVHTYNYIEISVSDNGGGVPKDKEEWIFGVNNSLKKDQGGQGFGLYSAREYMREIGGDLILENRFPKGATFKLHFPEYIEELHETMAEELNIKGGK